MLTHTGAAERSQAATTRFDREFADAVLAGLAMAQKSLPSRYFYDHRGSSLFEKITRLPEYYLTRAEAKALAAHAGEIAGGTGREIVLVELGSGSSRKTEILIDAMEDLAAYIAIDVSPDALIDARHRLVDIYPRLDLRAIVADFSQPLHLPHDLERYRKLGFFPGSTIGNLEPPQAIALLANVRRMLGPGGRLVVGADLVKDEATLIRAYDDPGGVTALFNLNVLDRINRTFGPTFDLDAFDHRAAYDRRNQRIEMHLLSRHEQTIELLGHTFRFRRGETIHTESSHKYTNESFADLARQAGWRRNRVWFDPQCLFSIHELLQET